MPTGGITSDEEKTFIDIAEQVTQPYSHSFFNATAQLLPVIATELVVVRWAWRGLWFKRQVLLVWRPAEEHYPWPNVWHCPGRIARVTHTGGFPQMIEDLERTEVGCKVVKPRRVDEQVIPDFAGRKLVFQFIYVARPARGQTPKGEWHDIDNLPEGTAPEHAAMLRRLFP